MTPVEKLCVVRRRDSWQSRSPGRPPSRAMPPSRQAPPPAGSAAGTSGDSTTRHGADLRGRLDRTGRCAAVRSGTWSRHRPGAHNVVVTARRTPTPSPPPPRCRSPASTRRPPRHRGHRHRHRHDGVGLHLQHRRRAALRRRRRSRDQPPDMPVRAADRSPDQHHGDRTRPCRHRLQHPARRAPAPRPSHDVLGHPRSGADWVPDRGPHQGLDPADRRRRERSDRHAGGE